MNNVSLAVAFLNNALHETKDMAKKKEWLKSGMKELEGTKHWTEANIDRYRRILEYLDNIHENPPGAPFYEDVERLNQRWLEMAQELLRDVLREIPEWFRR
ncbi:MAG TPA: hypothetical protein VJG90_06185 [Candidatus Nanoarchaeia archaeon]|nr:hypothetical protein [Candidatus Nanoarchaeia archaeon]